jgi:hypothetical protein
VKSDAQGNHPMQSIRTYFTDADLADLKSDTEGATLYIVPHDGGTDWPTLGRLVKRATEVLTANDRPRSVEIQLRQNCWLNSEQIRQLSRMPHFQDAG